MAMNSGAGKGREQGSAVIVALLAFMVICLMGTALLSAAAIERKVAVSQNRVELLRQAADAGIEAGRNIIINYWAAGQALPAMEDIYLENECRVEINCDLDSLNDNGIISITARAFMEDANGNLIASKAARADLLLDDWPACGIRAKTLKLAGSYYTVVSAQEIDPGGKQDWDVNDSESCLAGDPGQPAFYPLNGPCLNSFKEDYQLQHPYFQLDTQYWPGVADLDYTWWVDYAYASLDEDNFHDLDNSLINIRPFYRPYGYLEIVGKDGQAGQIGLKEGWINTLSADEENELFIDTLSQPAWGCFNSEEYYQAELLDRLVSSGGSIIYPEKLFRSQDFAQNLQVVENLAAPDLPSELLASYKRLAGVNPAWEYIPESSDKLSFNKGEYQVDIDTLNQAYIYLDCPPGETLLFDFNAVLGPGGCLMDWLAGTTAPLFDSIRDEQRSVIIVSPANLEVIMDSIMFEYLNSETRFYLISAGDIDITLKPLTVEFPSSPRNIQAFLWAGENINISSRVMGCCYSGFIKAGNQLFIQILNPGGIMEQEPYFRMEKNAAIIQHFPEAWAYLGLCPIIAYSYID